MMKRNKTTRDDTPEIEIDPSVLSAIAAKENGSDYIEKLYSDNYKNRIVPCEGEIDPDMTGDIIKLIIHYNQEDYGKPVEERKPIRLMINTYGGDVQTMWSIIKLMKMSKTPVDTVAISNAMSAGSHILAAGRHRYILDGCTVMIHSGSVGMSGTSEQVAAANKYFAALNDEVNKQLLADTKIDSKTFKKRAPGDWYLNAEDCIKYGVVDEIITDLDVLFGD